MSLPAAIHIVSPAEFDCGTAQTPGSERRAAITPALGIDSPIWGGLFEVAPGARTGIHHHGEQQTIAYVLAAPARYAGAMQANSRRAPKPAISFMCPPSCRTWKSTLPGWSRFDGSSCAAPQRRSSSTFRTIPGRESELPAAKNATHNAKVTG
jgi:hypothetical protein